jgi:hypothetical protein
VLIGVKEQCDLYPNILSLLADESGISVHIAEIAEDTAPAIKTNNKSNLIEIFKIFLAFI